MDNIEVGTYRLGMRYVRVIAVPKSEDGQVVVFPGNESIPEIFIGIDQDWSSVVGTLLHEAYELSLIDLNCRYKKKPSMSVESSDFTFIATHNEMGEAHERVGEFLAGCFPALGKTYNAVRQHEKKIESIKKKLKRKK